jgi:hypothetical protein
MEPGAGRDSSVAGVATEGAAGPSSSFTWSGFSGAAAWGTGTSSAVSGSSWFSSVSLCESASGSRSGASNPYNRRSLMATSSSMELECVFFSATPNSGSRSRIS